MPVPSGYLHKALGGFAAYYSEFKITAVNKVSGGACGYLEGGTCAATSTFEAVTSGVAEGQVQYLWSATGGATITQNNETWVEATGPDNDQDSPWTVTCQVTDVVENNVTTASYDEVDYKTQNNLINYRLYGEPVPTGWTDGYVNWAANATLERTENKNNIWKIGSVGQTTQTALTQTVTVIPDAIYTFTVFIEEIFQQPTEAGLAFSNVTYPSGAPQPLVQGLNTVRVLVDPGQTEVTVTMGVGISTPGLGCFEFRSTAMLDGMQVLDIDRTGGSCEYPAAGACVAQSVYNVNVFGGGVLEYLWEVDAPATIVGSNTNSTCTVVTPSGTSPVGYFVSCDVTDQYFHEQRTQFFIDTKTEEVPIWQTYLEFDQLYPAAGSGADAYGWSTGYSDSTQTLAVGYGNGTVSKVDVYVYNNGTWDFEQTITGSDSVSGDQFGSSGIDVDGDTIVVGAYYHDSNGQDEAGAAYVFTRSGGTWTEEQKLTADVPTTYCAFGWTCKLEGDTLVIGAPRDDGPGSNVGTVHVFTRAATVWTHQQKLVPSLTSSGGNFGQAIAFEGNTIIASGPFTSRAFVFKLSGTWTEDHTITGITRATEMDMDGTNLIIGDDSFNVNTGKAYLCTESGGTWSIAQEILPSTPASGDKFGHAVSISGKSFLVGAPEKDTNGSGSGGVYAFVESGGTWTEKATVYPSLTGSGFKFGFDVIMDGVLGVMAQPSDTTVAYNVGGVYTYITPEPGITISSITRDSGGTCEYPAAGACVAQSVYSVAYAFETGAVAYQWSVDGGASIVGSATGTTVTVDGPSSATNDSYNVTCELTDDNSTVTEVTSFTDTKSEYVPPSDPTSWKNLGLRIGGVTSVLDIAFDTEDTFILVGEDGKAARTTDFGVTTTAISPNYLNSGAASGDMWSIATDHNGTCVCMVNSGYASRSTDGGATWTALPQFLGLGSGDFRVVSWANGVFIAGSRFTGEAARSTDGLTWTLLPAHLNSGSSTGSLICVEGSASGAWVAMFQGGFSSLSQDNGLTWTILPQYLNNGNAGTVFRIATDSNGLWFMTSKLANTATSTDDGVTWSRSQDSFGAAAAPISITYAGGHFITGIQSSHSRYRPDGDGWYPCPRPLDPDSVNYYDPTIAAGYKDRAILANVNQTSISPKI